MNEDEINASIVLHYDSWLISNLNSYIYLIFKKLDIFTDPICLKYYDDTDWVVYREIKDYQNDIWIKLRSCSSIIKKKNTNWIKL